MTHSHQWVSINDSVLDELFKNEGLPSDPLGSAGLVTRFKKRLINCVLDSEPAT